MIKIIDKIGLTVQLTDEVPIFKFDKASSLQMIASRIQEFKTSTVSSIIRLSRSLSERHEECVALGTRKMSKSRKSVHFRSQIAWFWAETFGWRSRF